MQAREEKFKAEAAAKAAAEEAAKVGASTSSPRSTSTADALFCFITLHLQIAKMTPEELERLRNRCKKFGLPFPGDYLLLPRCRGCHACALPPLPSLRLTPVLCSGEAQPSS